MCCNIPISAEINTIGINTLKRTKTLFDLLIHQIQNSHRQQRYFNNSPKPSAIPLINIFPTLVFNNKNPKMNCNITIVMIGRYLTFFYHY